MSEQDPDDIALFRAHALKHARNNRRLIGDAQLRPRAPRWFLAIVVALAVSTICAILLGVYRPGYDIVAPIRVLSEAPAVIESRVIIHGNAGCQLREGQRARVRISGERDIHGVVQALADRRHPTSRAKFPGATSFVTVQIQADGPLPHFKATQSSPPQGAAIHFTFDAVSGWDWIASAFRFTWMRGE